MLFMTEITTKSYSIDLLFETVRFCHHPAPRTWYVQKENYALSSKDPERTFGLAASEILIEIPRKMCGNSSSRFSGSFPAGLGPLWYVRVCVRHGRASSRPRAE